MYLYSYIFIKTCHETFFDLDDAFGSISHTFIDKVLARYQMLDNARRYINIFYINGSVLGPNCEMRDLSLSNVFFRVIHYH